MNRILKFALFALWAIVSPFAFMLICIVALPGLLLLFVLCAIEGATRGVLSRRLGTSLD